MLRIAFPVVLAVLTGVGIVIQQALNADLRRSLNSAAWPGFANFFIGLIFMIVLVLALRDPLPSIGTLARVPWWAWSGGVFGAIFIAVGILLIPQIGAAAFIALLFTGQMLASVVFDHFGWLGLTPRPVDLPKVIGVLLLIAGVVLVRR